MRVVRQGLQTWASSTSPQRPGHQARQITHGALGRKNRNFPEARSGCRQCTTGAPNLSRVVAASPPLPPPPPPPPPTTTTTTTTCAWVFEPTIGQKTAQGRSISFDVSNCNDNVYGAAKIEWGRAHRSRRDRIRQHELARHVPARAARVRRQEAVFRSAAAPGAPGRSGVPAQPPDAVPATHTLEIQRHPFRNLKT